MEKAKKKKIPDKIVKRLKRIHKEVDRLNEEDKILIARIRREINARQRKAS